MEPVTGTYNMVLVGLSYVISTFGSFTALRLARQIPNSDAASRRIWVLLASIALGAGGIWSMHFIGMLAFETGMLVSYDVGLTLLSLLIAIAFTAGGFLVAGQGTPSIARFAGAGTLMGSGIAGMHYTGMAAMRMRMDMSYDTILLVVSIVIAVVASAVALWLAFNVEKTWQMVVSALVMGVAVCGMHYTGMAAMILVRNPALPGPAGVTFSPLLLAYSVFCLSLIVLTAGLVVGSQRREGGYSLG